MRFFLLCFSLAIYQSCANNGSSAAATEIQIEHYSITFPSSYKKITRETFNSYVGKISNDTVTYNFEYSNHVQVPFITPQAFIQSGKWQPAVEYELFITRKMAIDAITYSIPRVATEKDSAIGKGCDYTVKYKLGHYEGEAPIYLPEQAKNMTVTTDTVFGQERKVGIPKNPGTGITGIFIHPISGNTHPKAALLLTAGHLTMTQQKEALQIFSTIRSNIPQ